MYIWRLYIWRFQMWYTNIGNWRISLNSFTSSTEAYDSQSWLIRTKVYPPISWLTLRLFPGCGCSFQKRQNYSHRSQINGSQRLGFDEEDCLQKILQGYWTDGASGTEPAGQCRRYKNIALISGWGRSPGEGNGNPLQHSCLESPIDPGAWQPTVHRVAQRQTRLNAQQSIFWLDDSYATVYIGQNFLNFVLKECELIVCKYLSKIRFYFSDVKIHFFVLLLPFNLKNYVTLKGIYF